MSLPEFEIAIDKAIRDARNTLWEKYKANPKDVNVFFELENTSEVRLTPFRLNQNSIILDLKIFP